MGGRFKQISTGDGWRKIIRLDGSASTTATLSKRRQPGKYRNFNAHVPKFTKNQNSLYQRRPNPSNHLTTSNVLYQPNGTLSSLIAYSHVIPSSKNPNLYNHIATPNKNNSRLANLLHFTEPNTHRTIHPQSAMTRKKANHPATNPKQHHRNTNSQTDNMITPTRSFAKIVSPPSNIHLIQHPYRYPQPVWKSYLDNNPWTFASPSETQTTVNDSTNQPPEALPLPPDPTHYRWRGRCYNCLDLGHDQNECTRLERVCAKCWTSGHEARVCTVNTVQRQPQFDPLMPRGNIGDDKMPKNRPHMTMVFVPQTNQMQQESCEMLRAIVIDARLREHHNIHILQSILMATCATPYPFPLSKINDNQYLLVLPPGIDRQSFLSTHVAQLGETGYVAFPWSAAVNGTPMQMRFKVWIELIGMSPCSWTIEHLLRAAGSFGIVLEHATMANRASLERMRAVVAVPDLELVPLNTGVWVRGIFRNVRVAVHAWIEEPIPNPTPPDSTPPKSFFEQVRSRYSGHSTGPSDQSKTPDSLTVDFDTLYAGWKSMAGGAEKQNIEQILRSSPLFAARLGCISVINDQNVGSDTVVESGGDMQLDGASASLTGPKFGGVQCHNIINEGGTILAHAENSNILQGTGNSAGSVMEQSDVDHTVTVNHSLQSNETNTLLNQEDVDSAGTQILKAILSANSPPIKAHIETSKNPLSNQPNGSENYSGLSPKSLSFRDSPEPNDNNICPGPIIAPLYPMELTGGVPLPADVDPEIAANFAANKGPHVRCLTPYLTLPPTPISHPWIYTTEEIKTYKAKLVLTTTVPDDPTTENEYPNTNRDTESELGDDEMGFGTDAESDGVPKQRPGKEHVQSGNDSDADPVGGLDRATKLQIGNTRTPRRSRRIAERTPGRKTHSPKKTRAQGNTSGKRKSHSDLDQAQMMLIAEALEAEQLESIPLQADMIEKVNSYCGTHLGNRLIPMEGAASNPDLLAGLTAGYEEEESILKSLEYNPEEDDFTDDDDEEEEPIEEPMEEEPEEEMMEDVPVEEVPFDGHDVASD